MAENTNTEREAFEASYLRDFPGKQGRLGLTRRSSGSIGYEHAMVQCRWEGFLAGRASLSLPAAGQEPVAHLWQHSETGRTRVVMPDMIVDADASWQVVGPLYLGAAPQPAVAAGWMPMQPIVWAKDGCIRFLANRMVNDLYEFACPRGMGLNEMAAGDYTAEERMQFAQLIGYSVSGYGGLSYVSDESRDKADTIAAALPPAPSTEGEING